MNPQSKRLLGICALVVIVAVGTGVGFDRWRSAKVAKPPSASPAARVVPPLPRAGALLASTDEAEVRGKAFCAYCFYNVGNNCHTLLKTESEPGVVFLARNEKLAELDKITGVCAGGKIEVSARGLVSQYQDQNYLLVRSFETISTATK